MDETAILAAVHARLAKALAPAQPPLVAFLVEDRIAGRLTQERASRLTAFAGLFEQDERGLRLADAFASEPERTAAMAQVTAALAAEGALSAWRDERYAVARQRGADPWFLVERAAARYFGIRTTAVHVNGIVRRDGVRRMWIARRSPSKPIDPGMLDNLVGGGVAAGASLEATLVREAREEAGIPEALARTARRSGVVHVRRLLPDGWQDETIHVHDLALPADFLPVNQDGEVAAFVAMTPGEVLRVLAREDGSDAMTVDASLVALDWLLRNKAIARDDPLRPALASLGH